MRLWVKTLAPPKYALRFYGFYALAPKYGSKFAEDSHLRSMDLTPAPSPSPAHPPARGRAPRGEDEAPFEENGETLNLGWKKKAITIFWRLSSAASCG